MQNGTAQGQTNQDIGLRKVSLNVLHFILFMRTEMTEVSASILHGRRGPAYVT